MSAMVVFRLQARRRGTFCARITPLASVHPSFTCGVGVEGGRGVISVHQFVELGGKGSCGPRRGRCSDTRARIAPGLLPSLELRAWVPSEQT